MAVGPEESGLVMALSRLPAAQKRSAAFTLQRLRNAYYDLFVSFQLLTSVLNAQHRERYGNGSAKT